ncbi:MAG TPA: hypothetical protein VK609_08170 [Mucilaginibacter sp.]|nr:hypothetical protein [Mucilaginibacter sp.]
MQHKALFILLLVVRPFCGFAQKAYETEQYTGKLNGRTIQLALANGYIGTSKISLFNTDKGKPVLFIPDMGTADDQSRLTFHSTQKRWQGYFMLNNIQDVYEQLPAYINGKYYLNKKIIAVKFRLVK